jgi:cystathionine beta-lyase
MLILCSPHNPVGRVWTKQELLRLGEICKRNNVIVLADEIHNDLIHNGAEHTVFASLGDFADFTVTCTAVSKTFNLAGLACSNILISNDTIADRFKAAAERENTSCVPYFARAATIAAYTKAEQWLDELNGVIESNFNLLYAFLRTELPMLNAIRAEGTYLAWIDMRSLGLSDSALEELMLKNYLALDEGYIFGTGGSGFERWNLALPQNELKAALERLKAAVLSLQSKQ